jgi:hypothetical protein
MASTAEGSSGTPSYVLRHFGENLLRIGEGSYFLPLVVTSVDTRPQKSSSQREGSWENEPKTLIVQKVRAKYSDRVDLLFREGRFGVRFSPKCGVHLV